MVVVSLPGLDGELKDARLCSVSSDKIILHSEKSEILIYDRQSYEIERYGCPSGRRQRWESTDAKVYQCVCHVTFDAVYHACTTREEKEGGSYNAKIQIHKLVDNSMRNVKTLKYCNASFFSVCGNTLCIKMNKKCISFSFELMKEFVFNNEFPFTVFTHRDCCYALDGRKLYLLDLSNARQRIELSDGETIGGDAMGGSFLKSHTVRDNVLIVNRFGHLCRLNMTNRKIEKLPIDLPSLRSFAFCDNELYYKHTSREIHKLDLTAFLLTQRETATKAVQDQEKPICPVCRETFQNPKVMPKCGHSVCNACEMRISVEEPIRKKKTLMCPMCRKAVELKIHEYLPVNWALRNLLALYDRGVSRKRAKHTLECPSCNKTLSEENTFECEFCAERDQKIEVLICAACGLDYHNKHSSRVKRVNFADVACKKRKIGGISRDPEEPRRDRSAMASTLMEVNKEIDVFFGGLEKDYERVNSRLEKLGGDCPITQKMMDKESEELMKDDGVIMKKLDKLSTWKATLRNISQPSNNEQRIYTSPTRALKNLPTLHDSQGGSLNGPRHSLECSSCNEPLSKKKTFDCEFCAERDQKTEVLICGACGLLYHNDHVSRVKLATFADATYKKGKIGGISRDPEEPKRQKSAMASTLMELNKEFDVFFRGLEKDYERVNSRLKKLGGDGSITQKMMDKESEELMKDDGVIKKKLEKLSTWKTTLRKISQLNNNK